MMPPAGARRPDAATLAALATALETRIDRAAALNPNPGRRPFQRLNRAEYARAVARPARHRRRRQRVPAARHDQPRLRQHRRRAGVLADADGRLPARGERRSAASRSAIRRQRRPRQTYKVPRTASQMQHVEGAPFGTRGGMSVVHMFPADGDYTFRMMLHTIPTGQLFGSTTRGEQIEVSIDGERVALLDINPRMSEADPKGMNLETPPISRQGGPAARRRRRSSRASRPGRRPDGADRAHAGRHADRQRPRHHDAAAPARPRHHRPAEVTGVSDTEAAAASSSAVRRRRRKRRRAPSRSCASWRRRRIAGR